MTKEREKNNGLTAMEASVSKQVQSAEEKREQKSGRATASICGGCTQRRGMSSCAWTYGRYDAGSGSVSGEDENKEGETVGSIEELDVAALYRLAYTTT